MATTSVLLRRRRWLLPALGVAAVAAAVALAAFQPWKAFVDDTVDEAAPVAAVAPTTGTNPAMIPAAPAATTSATTAPTSVVPTSAAPLPTAATAPPPAASVTPSTSAPTAPATTAPALPTSSAPVVTTAALIPPAEPAPTAFVSKAHDTSGTVRLLTLDDGSRVVRIENLSTSNGPDVKVVLSPDPNGYADGAVSLGTLKGNRGSQNYAIPADVDPSSFRSVVVWCKRFDVDFGVAPLPA